MPTTAIANTIGKIQQRLAATTANLPGSCDQKACCTLHRLPQDVEDGIA